MGQVVRIDQAEPHELGPGEYERVVLYRRSTLRLVGAGQIGTLTMMQGGEIDLSQFTGSIGTVETCGKKCAFVGLDEWKTAVNPCHII